MFTRLPSFVLIGLLALAGSAYAQDSEDPPDENPLPTVPTPPTPPPAAVAPAAEPAVPKAPALPPSDRVDFARANRLGLGLSFGFGSASLSDYHDKLPLPNRSLNADDFKTGLQISAELTLRYYAPYFVMGQIGYGTLYNAASASGFESHNLVMEVPILIGGYYTFFGRLYVHGAIGPSIFFFSRAYWDPGWDFETDGGTGMHLQFGAEYMVGEHFAFGIDLRYRSLSAGALKYKDTETVHSPETEFDMSGVAMILNLRVFAL